MATKPWTCAVCGMTFGGLSGFDAHRTGAFIDRHPDYGRRCRSAAEMEAKGYRQDSRGRWGKPMAEETRERLALRA